MRTVDTNTILSPLLGSSLGEPPHGELRSTIRSEVLYITIE